MNSKKTIIFTGGGSAGHVVPNLALCKKMQHDGWDTAYIGSKKGIEKDLVNKAKIPFYGITTGKLRRYFSWQNFIDPIKIFIGIIQAYLLCGEIKPNIVFAKGGFVAFPVIIAAWLNRIPVISHESDFTPGLANRLSFPFVNKICVTFAETKKLLPNPNKVIFTGTPIRPELFASQSLNGYKICNFNPNKKVILLFGGGSGSELINQTIREALPKLLPKFQIVHVCGKDKIEPNLNLQGYKQFEYIYDEFPDILASAYIVISRSGANSVYELLSLHKLHIFIPLSTKSSRGDQIDNAKYFTEKGYSQTILESELSAETIINKIFWICEHETEIKQHLVQFEKQDSINLIYDIIISTSTK